jgi:hypothetical protein
MIRTVVAAAAVFAVVPAFAAQRQFVASYGFDTNPCSLTLPCRGFAAAATAVDPGGEIIVLDSAGYGPVTVTKPLAIISPAGIYAGISVPSGQDGVVINIPGGKVRLEGLSINGTGGNVGIKVVAASEVAIDRCGIRLMSSHGVVSTGGAVTELTNVVSQANGGRDWR